MALASEKIDRLIREAVFAEEPARLKSGKKIFETAVKQGAYPSSIQTFYDAAGKGLFHGVTLPAINVRGITYDVSRAIFRAAMKNKVGVFIFEIARSEIGYTSQPPIEYSTCILAAAVKEGYEGPVFIQGDHFQFNRSKYLQSPVQETTDLQALVADAIAAGFYNIDIDASTLVDLSKPTLVEQQNANSRMTAEMTKYIRSLQPEGVIISIGGEIGEIGKGNSTVEDYEAFMTGYLDYIGPEIKGISKISVQTGTSHGGVVLPDGRIADVQLDFQVLKNISRVAQQKYGLGGAVQHGASTLPDTAFDMFPKVNAIEVHLATGFQNIIFDSKHFPEDLRQQINQDILKRYKGERSPNDTDEQLIYKSRKKSFGDFKHQMWDIPADKMTFIREELEERFGFLFRKLNVANTVNLVSKYIKKTNN